MVHVVTKETIRVTHSQLYRRVKTNGISIPQWFSSFQLKIVLIDCVVFQVQGPWCQSPQTLKPAIVKHRQTLTFSSVPNLRGFGAHISCVGNHNTRESTNQTNHHVQLARSH